VLSVTDDLSLTGAGMDATMIDGGTTDRVFQVGASALVHMADLTVQNGYAPDSPEAFDDGGGIYSAGTLTLTNVTIKNNSAPFFGCGGGIFNSGLLTLTHVVVDSNNAYYAGGICNDGTLSLIESSVTNNATTGAVGSGGGIWNKEGTATLTYTTVSGNTAPVGGGIRNSNQLTIRNSTISGNAVSVSVGGGVDNDTGAGLEVTNSTISGNSAKTYGGGIYNQSLVGLFNATVANNSVATGSGGGIYSNGGAIEVGGTLFAANTAGGSANNCAIAGGGSLTTDGYNLEDGNTCGLSGTGDLVNTNPNLGPLQDNGGPTYTHALLAGSPAIDAENASVCVDLPSGGFPLATDQRGFARPVDGDANGSAVCDIGAYEAGASAALGTDLSVTLFA
jgi:hypothetical protein